MCREGLTISSLEAETTESDLKPPIRTRTFATLVENNDYRTYYIGQGISLIGTWIQQAAVLWLVLELTNSEKWLGIIDASGILPSVLVALFAGALADRVPPRRMVVVMLVVQTLLASVLAALVASGRLQVWHMGVILALNRVAVTFEMPSRQVMLFGIVGRDRLMNAIALNSGLFNASRVIGPALSGFLLVRYGATACFTLNALSFLAAIAAAMAIHPVPASTEAGSGKGAGDLLGGLRFLGSCPRVRRLFYAMFGFGVLGMGYSALLPAYARKVLGRDAGGYSMLLAMAGLGATLGALLVASLGNSKRKEHLLLAGIVLFAVAMLGAGGLPSVFTRAGLSGLRFPLACVCLMLGGFGGILFYSSTQTLIQLAAPDAIRGRVIGLWLIGFSSSVPLGSLWSGMLASRFGVSAVLETAAVLCLGLAAAVALGLRQGGPLPLTGLSSAP